MEHLTNISLIDSIYNDKTTEIKKYFSEYSNIKYKLLIMIEYLISLSKIELLDLTNEDIQYLKNIYINFKLEDCKNFNNLFHIKEYDTYIRNKINLNKNLEEKGISIFINFSIVDEDIYNLVNIISIKNGNIKVLLPSISILLDKIKKNILKYSKIAIVTRIGSKKNEPSFLGKELLVYYERLVIQSRKLNSIKYTAKFGGSNGNFNSLHFSLPNIDWMDFADKFIKLLGMERNQYTTYYDHLDNYSEIFHSIVRINNILLDISNFIKTYHEMGHLVIDNDLKYFDEIESLLLVSNNLLNFLSDILPKKNYLNNMLLKNLGLIYSNIIISINKLNEIFENIKINKPLIDNELDKNRHLILDGICARLKILGVENTDELINSIDDKNNQKKITHFINDLEIDIKEKKYLNTISTFNYTGLYKL